MSNVITAVLALLLFFGGIAVFVTSFEAPSGWHTTLAIAGIVITSGALFVPRWLAERTDGR